MQQKVIPFRRDLCIKNGTGPEICYLLSIENLKFLSNHYETWSELATYEYQLECKFFYQMQIYMRQFHF